MADRPQTAVDSQLDGTPSSGSQPSWKRHGWAAEGPPPTGRGESFGRYVILHELGAGGMGVVYAAYDPELDRRVALKVLGEDTQDETSHARLLREAQTMARISHPNVITVHDVGFVDERLFIAMELVEGHDLKAWLKEEHGWEEVLDVLQQAGRGLAAAHEQGLIHRDFKPANVLVGDDGLVRVLDFGLARRVGAPEDAGGNTDELSSSHSSHTEALTRTGAIAGTPAYMSPEQHARAELDDKSDQFSFCITAFEALFGERPFDGHGRMALMLKATQGDHRPLPKGTPVPSRVSDAVLRGLAPKPADRWPDMNALLAQLSVQRRPGRWIALGLASAVGVGVGAVALAGPTEAPPCAGLDDVGRGLLPEDTRTRIDQAFGASATPYAAASLQATLATLDRYVDAWTAERVDACEATRVRGDHSESMLDLRVACLERRRRDFEAVTEVLADADAMTIQRASEVVRALQPTTECGNVEALLAAYPPPDPSIAEAVEAAEALLGRGKALLNARRDAEAKDVLEHAVTAAQTSTYLPVIADAQLQLAVSLHWNAERDGAVERFHQAAQTAARVGDDRLLALTWIALGRHLSNSNNDYETAFRWLEYAQSLLARQPYDDFLHSELRIARATTLSELGRLDEAIAEIDALRAARPEGLTTTAPELVLLGNVYTWKADFDRARDAFTQSVAIVTETNGPGHPSLGAAYNGLGVVAFSVGQLEDAEQHFKDSYDVQRAVLAADSPSLLFSIGNVGELRRMRGDYAGALEAMLEVEGLVKRAYPAVHREVGTTNHNIASNYLEWGKPEQALPRFDVAIGVRREVHGPEHAYVANSLTGKGLALLELERGEEALQLLEEALEIRGKTEAPPRKFAATEFGVARALGRTGGDRARAERLARSARDRLAEQASDEAIAKRLSEIDAWLVDADAPKDPSPASAR
ncbi:MAG: serine/threonine-protein kinase [Myxococcota bacterium]